MDVEMEVVHCANCQVTFAMTEDMIGRRRKDHKTFYCPNGHTNYFAGKTDEEKLKEQLKLKDQQLQAKLNELDEAREAARNLREARVEFIGKFLNEQFKQGKKSLLLKDIAPVFGMKAKDLKEHIDIYMPDFKFTRTGKGYEIVKNTEEKKEK